MTAPPVLVCDPLGALPPGPLAELVGSRDGLVEHQIQQLGLARHVRVEGHRSDRELLSNPSHRERLEPLRICNVHCRSNDLVEVEPWLRPLARGAVIAPQKLDAPRGGVIFILLAHEWVRTLYGSPYRIRISSILSDR